MYAFFFLILLASATAYSASVTIDEECLNYTVYPVQYDLTIKPIIFKNGRITYDCDMIITLIANAPQVMSIELDARDIEIIEGSVMVVNDGRNIINRNTPYVLDRRSGKLIIYLSVPLIKFDSVYQTQYLLKIKFRKIVRLDTSGVFSAKYNEERDSTKYLFLTRLSGGHAKYFFPCFSDPRFEAGFKFKVYGIPGQRDWQYSNTSIVISKEERQTRLSDGRILFEYQPSRQVALHELGFVYSQFANISIQASHTNDTLVIWAPAMLLQYHNFMLKFGQSIMDFIHEYSRVNRVIVNGPINVVSVPAVLDGYEIGSWNVLTNGDYRLAYVPEYSSIRQMETMTFELTQQLCRIWLGNPGEEGQRTKWREEWFKEGVATYLAYYFLGRYHRHEQNIKSGWPLGFYGLEMRRKAMALDWHHSSPALITFNNTLAVEIPRRYKELVTMKTASLLTMLENWIGSEKFHTALVKYINMRRGNYISLADFMLRLDENTVECMLQFFNGTTSSRVLDSWFHQSGYPVVNVQVFRDRNPNVILLKQRKFSFINEYRTQTKYLIPISYVMQNNQDCYNCHQPRFTIGANSYSFTENLNGGWIILNRRGSGYYRVNYDVDSWKLIARTLRLDHTSIDELNRAMIVNDVFALYTAGDIELELAKEILNYLDKEQSYVVWDSVIDGFELLKVERAACGMTQTLYGVWQEFMRSKTAAIYESLVEDLEQQLKTRLFRSNIINFACSINYEPCLHRVRLMLAEQYKRMDPDSREACYYVALSDEKDLPRQLTRFELEDKTIATRRRNDINHFHYWAPPGEKIPKIIMTTVAPTQTGPKADPQGPPDSSSSIHASMICIIILYISLMMLK